MALSSHHGEGTPSVKSVCENLVPLIEHCESVLRLVELVGGMERLAKIVDRWSGYFADAQIIPESGTFDLVGWMALLDRKENTVRTLMKRNNIPQKKLGNSALHSALDLMRFAGMDEIDEETQEDQEPGKR